MKILIAEDEQDMLKIIRLYLEKDGHQVSIASDGKQALELVYNEKFDLLITDWMMPIINGVELCKEIREAKIPLKIIMLTAKGNISDEILGLTCGADDYIKKPFEPQLLLIRIQKLFKFEKQIRCDDLILNIENHTVFLADKEIKVTQKEWMLLELFMKNMGATLARNTLIESIWGIEYEGDERTLDTHIRRLRNKIGQGYIQTFIGVGYRMDKNNE